MSVFMVLYLWYSNGLPYHVIRQFENMTKSVQKFKNSNVCIFGCLVFIWLLYVGMLVEF